MVEDLSYYINKEKLTEIQFEILCTKEEVISVKLNGMSNVRIGYKWYTIELQDSSLYDIYVK